MLKEILFRIAQLLNSFDFETLSSKSRHQVQYELKEAKKEQIEVITEIIPLPKDIIKVDSVKKDISTSLLTTPTIPVPKGKSIEIIDMLLPLSETMGKRKYTPNAFCLHHSGGSSLLGMYSWFKSQPVKISTNFAIDKDGKIYKFMEEDIWAYSLGLRFESNKIPSKYKTREHSDKIEQLSFGVEIVCEGEVIKKEEGFWFEGGKRYVDKDSVITLNTPFKGYQHFVKYTDKQIVALEKLIDYLCTKYSIKKEWIGTFEVEVSALEGKSGIFSHTNYRSSGKTDIFPQKEIIEMLKSLKNL